MNKRSLSLFIVLTLALSAGPVLAGKAAIRSPESGVLCDRYFCATRMGVSREMTEKHLGRSTVARLYSHGDFDSTEFTFANGVFCDAKERVCRQDRYFGKDGKRSGTISDKYTRLLFQRD